MPTHSSETPRITMFKLTCASRRSLLQSGVSIAFAWAGVASATTAISNVPPALQTSGGARTNVMFVLDDSGSMDNDYLPDSLSTGSNCFGYFGYNKIFYNPTETYTPPPRGDGTFYPNAPWPTVHYDGYTQSGGTINLNSNTSGPWNKTDGRYWYTTYGGTGTPTSCSSSSYTRVTSLPAAQQQNYANWYSYYRTRKLAMRAGAGKAFDRVDASKLRVGFATIHQPVATNPVADSAEFLNVGNFDRDTSSTAPAFSTQHRGKWFSKLYSSETTSGTPLRPALELMGKYYANKARNQTVDPVQYSCQRNYTILSSDGYWNTDGQPSGWSATRVNGSALGDQDGAADRPYRDSSAASPTLADIAYHYYVTDLRTPALNNCGTANVCDNKVAPFGRDTATHQHMTTYTLGLGLSGTLAYSPSYENDATGSYRNIVNGTANWPNPITSSAGARLDDLWHAAVNGRGYFYSASDSDDLAAVLSTALNQIDDATGASAAASTSSLRPVSGDDKAFVAKYTSGSWHGQLESYTVNTTTGEITNPTAPNWEAGALLTARNLTTSPRSIRFFNSTAADKLSAFATDLSPTQLAYFQNLCSGSPTKLSQCATLKTPALSKVTAANVIDFLTGSRALEMTLGAPENDQVFRARASRLGDFVNASPVYVKAPPFSYADAGYAAFKAREASRTAVVFTASNDGMLHAFSATTGQELWAFVPSMVMPEMYRLADSKYGDGENHRFYVDATPVVADVYDPGTPTTTGGWRTILVGGLGGGGRGYYALDITNPASPKGLWEFTDTHLGLTYGNPIITKDKDDTWVVMFTSGYNNNSGGGDGNGRLYTLNAVTGQQMSGSPIQTYASVGSTVEVGTAAAPNNLGRINAWVEDETNNTALRVYAGDMRGNLWRFDHDDNIAPAGREALLLAQARTDGAAAEQPITVRPMLTLVKSGNVDVPLVSFATGRYLNQADITDTTRQSVYVVKDPLDTTTLGVLRTNGAMVEQTIDTSTNLVTTPRSVDFATAAGWFADFRTSGARVNVDMQQQYYTLTLATNIPTATPCSPGGTAQLYYFDLRSGRVLATQTFGTPIVGLTTIVVDTAGGNPGKAVTEVTTGTGTITTVEDPNLASTGTLTPRRTSWRELIN
jgi:type IV pilus assembly protein PilY1